MSARPARRPPTPPTGHRDRSGPVPDRVLTLPEYPKYVLVPLEEYERLTMRELVQEARRVGEDPGTEWLDADAVAKQFAAEKLVAARKARGLTQQDLGKLVGLPQSQISRLERNPDSATVRTLKKIARALKVDVSALV